MKHENPPVSSTEVVPEQGSVLHLQLPSPLTALSPLASNAQNIWTNHDVVDRNGWNRHSAGFYRTSGLLTYLISVTDIPPLGCLFPRLPLFHSCTVQSPSPICVTCNHVRYCSNSCMIIIVSVMVIVKIESVATGEIQQSLNGWCLYACYSTANSDRWSVLVQDYTVSYVCSS